MAEWLAIESGNPSSLHAGGRQARAAIDEAREVLAAAFGVSFGEVVFTSSGTEAVHLAIVGTALAHTGSRRRILLSAAEHHCAVATAPLLRRLGLTVEFVPVDAAGAVDVSALAAMAGDDVLLVSAMSVNNETGAITDLAGVQAIAERYGILWHCDAVQSFHSSEVELPPADLISVSAHKIHGPKGVGGLYIRAGTPIEATLPGGGQERDMRAGTENVAGIVGFAAAVRQTQAHPEWFAARRAARDAFAERAIIREHMTIPIERSSGGHCHVRWPGVDAATLLIRLDRAGVAASSGAACSSGSIEPSHVMLAMGWDEVAAREAVRFTFDHFVSPAQARRASEIVEGCVQQVRAARG